jgi:Flp pilus assembly pilin Flp
MLDYLYMLFTRTFFSDEEGQTAVEYALVLLLVALALVTVLATGLGGALGNAVTKIANSLNK